ncbi:MAG: hypothetical protein ACHQ2Z_00615 [Elusimicrobiota bacterium]
MKRAEIVLVVYGYSMRYLLKGRDLIKVQPVAAERLRLGDVIAYIGPAGQFVVHRLIWKTRDGARWRLWTKGDIWFFVDKPVMDFSLVGRVIAFQPPGGEWIELESAQARVKHLLVGLFSAFFFRFHLCYVSLAWRRNPPIQPTSTAPTSLGGASKKRPWSLT